MKGAFTPMSAFVLLLIGALAMAGIPPALDALAAPGVPLLWWAIRALGLLSYLALWLATLFGVLTGSRGAGGLLDPATITSLHRRWSMAAVATVGLHLALVVADPMSGVSAFGALVPLASERLTGPVALGTLSTWGLLLLAVSTSTPALPRWVWRAIHATAFGTWLLALVHGVTAGTESDLPWVDALYLGTAAALVGALVQRLLLAMHDARSSTRPPGTSRPDSNRSHTLESTP